jgi:hypothetical protein
MKKTITFFFGLVICLCLASCLANVHQANNPKVYRDLEEALENKETVEVLVLTRLNLDTFPSQILDFKNLRILNLSFNRLKKIPPTISKLQKLERIALMENELTELPYELVYMEKLKALLLLGNQLHEEDLFFLREKKPDCKVLLYYSKYSKPNRDY